MTPAPVPNTAPTVARERLPESTSLLLDIMRFTLALLVVVGHITLPWFSATWPPLLAWADAAVPGFFVLSGFMIRYVTEDRERDPRRYFISRASRMYSVLLPAIVLTLACNAITYHFDPAFGAFLFRPVGPLAGLGRIVAHLLFYTQFWGHSILLVPNLPLWSLGYEVPYYVLFGLIVLCRGPWRWLAAAAYALALGPQVLFLLPLWWSGCWLYDLWQWSRNGPAPRAKHAPTARLELASTKRTITTAAACFAATLLLLLPLHGASGWARIAHAPNPLEQLHWNSVRATMPAYASGLVCFALMFLGLAASDRIHLSRNAAWARPVRRIAEGTFTLYLFHYPLFVALRAAWHDRFMTNTSTACFLLGVVLVCVLAAVPVDALKRHMRRWLTKQLA